MKPDRRRGEALHARDPQNVRPAHNENATESHKEIHTMISPATLTPDLIEHIPSTLEEGLDELRAIADHTRVNPSLDHLPTLIKRTLFLKTHLENGLLAIEKDLRTLTDDTPDPAPSLPHVDSSVPGVSTSGL